MRSRISRGISDSESKPMFQVDLIAGQRGDVRADRGGAMLAKRPVRGRGPAAVAMVVEAAPETDGEVALALEGEAARQCTERARAQFLPAADTITRPNSFDEPLERDLVLASGLQPPEAHYPEKAPPHTSERPPPVGP